PESASRPAASVILSRSVARSKETWSARHPLLTASYMIAAILPGWRRSRRPVRPLLFKRNRKSGAILIYLADKTGKLLPKSGEERYRVLEWLMWQMGGPGPIFGQVHHFVNTIRPPTRKSATSKKPIGFTTCSIAGSPSTSSWLHRRHRHLAVGLALRVAD